MNLAWFIPGVVMFVVGVLSITPVVYLLDNKPVLRPWVLLGALFSGLIGGIIAGHADARDEFRIVIISVAALSVLELLVFEHRRMRRAELPEEYRLVLGRHYAVWTDAKRYSGELRIMTANELVLYESIRGWSVVYRDQITGYGPKDS